MKYSFDAAAKTCKIPPQLFGNGYIFVSIDVTSLLTNMSLNKTVEIISDPVCNENLVNTDEGKRSLKKQINILVEKMYSLQTRNYINRLMALVCVISLDHYY